MTALRAVIPGPRRAGSTIRRIRLRDDPAATLSAYPWPICQLAVTGLGHTSPPC
jgi:hypothetical protein